MRDLVEVYRRWQAGDSPRKIAKGLGLSRNTAREYVRAAEAAGITRERVLTAEEWAGFVRERFPETESAVARAVWWTELERYREEIVQRLGENRVTTVWERMREEGKVEASLSTFRRYVHAQIPQAVDAQRVVIHGAECEPGELAQVDFGRLGTWVDPVTGRQRILQAFIMVLVFSRHLFVQPVLSMDKAAWLRCHLRAFSFLGGVPSRIVLDNLKDGVLKPDVYDPQLNRAYAEMARHYDVLLDPARKAHPKDKPHVERDVPYVRERLFHGREERFSDLRAGEAWAEQWCREEAGMRIHRTTGRRPWELFQERELAALRPLPAEPWELCSWERANVAADSTCLVAGARYSVPWRLLEQTLDARVTETRVEFYRETELVKVHVRGQRGRRQIDDADLPAERIAFFRRTPQWCLEQAERVGPEVRAAVADLLQVRTNARLRQAQRILELEATYGPARLVGACARACAYGDPRYLTIKNILAAGLDRRPGEMPLWPLERPTEAGAFLRGASAFGAGSDPSPAGVAPVLPSAGGGASTDSPSGPDDRRDRVAHTGPQCDGVHAARPSHRPGTPPSARTRRVRRGRHTAVTTPPADPQRGQTPMAFIRWRGNSAELLATVYDHGRSRQVRLACLGGAFSVEPGVRAAVTERFPHIHVDWDAVEIAVTEGPPHEQARRAAAGMPNDRIEWLDLERRLHYWAILTEPLRPGEAQRLRAAAAVLHAWREAKPDFAFAEPPAGWDKPLAPEARSMTSDGILDPANVRASR